MLRTTRRLTITVILTTSLAGAAGCGSEPTPKDPTDHVDRSERVKIGQSRKLIDRANEEISTKGYSKARELIAEATKLGVESHRFEIRETVEKLDKREAKLWANDVQEVIGDKKHCRDAFKELAEPIGKLDSDAFVQELRKLIGTEAVDCAERVVEGAIKDGRFAAARSFARDDATSALLGEHVTGKLIAQVEAAIGDSLAAQLNDDVKGKDWAQALAKLDEMIKKKDASPQQAATLLGKIRDGAAPGIAERIKGAIGERDAAETLAEIDALIKSLKWQVMPPDRAELAKDKALPPDLVELRESLAVWVETQRQKMKAAKKPERRWTHGKIAVQPASDVSAPSKRDLQPSTEVWVLGQTKQLALVTTADPAGSALADQLGKAVGWVPVERLAKVATIDWIPPDDQLKGERVWAPLRAPDPRLELGTVSDIKGKDIMIKRMADDAIIKVARTSLRSGRLPLGTKVLAFCTAKDQVATIEEIIVAGRGVPAARLKCEDGRTKEEVLPSLRTKAEFLPPAR